MVKGFLALVALVLGLLVSAQSSPEGQGTQESLGAEHCELPEDSPLASVELALLVDADATLPERTLQLLSEQLQDFLLQVNVSLGPSKFSLVISIAIPVHMDLALVANSTKLDTARTIIDHVFSSSESLLLHLKLSDDKAQNDLQKTEATNELTLLGGLEKFLALRKLSSSRADELFVVAVGGLRTYSEAFTQKLLLDEAGPNKIMQRLQKLVSAVSLKVDPPHTSIAFLINPSSPSSLKAFGSISAQRFYVQNNAFNKALTLKSLIGPEHFLNNCLQSHLLAKGIPTVVESVSSFLASSSDVAMKRVLSILPKKQSSFWPINPCPGKLYVVDANDPISPQLNSSQGRWTREHLVRRHVPIVDWASGHEGEHLAEYLINRNEPIVVKSTPAATWTVTQEWKDLTTFASDTNLDNFNVKLGSKLHFFDSDSSAKMAALPLFNATVPYTVKNISKEELVTLMKGPTQKEDRSLNFFLPLPSHMREKINPDDFLFLTSEDFDLHKQFLWVSSPRYNTHTHFDQDFNVFVQLVGEKRFALFPPSQQNMLYPYPRLHPLWHKSQLNFDDPDLHLYPDYVHASAWEAILGPGDVLYLPPYTWHYVETLTPSISLSTLSHDDDIRDKMQALYHMDHKFDLLANTTGKAYALRLYLDMMVHDLMGNHPNETGLFFSRLLRTRYAAFYHLFPTHDGYCDHAAPIPTAQHVYNDCAQDMTFASEYFNSFPLEVRDFLFSDYAEELIAQVVGVENAVSFMASCFRGQTYRLTSQADEEHDWWWTYLDHDRDIGAPHSSH